MRDDLSPPPSTALGLLERAARQHPERGIAVFDARGRSHERRTFPEILAGVRSTAARWRGLGLETGQPVLVCLPTSWSFLDAWLGALWAGALPVAVAPPGGFGVADAQVQKVSDLVRRLDARYALVSQGFREQAEEREAGDLSRAALTVAELEGGATGRDAARADVSEGDCAFLQLTSGSTGFPRGVMISHRAVVRNAIAIDRALCSTATREPLHSWADALVGWLPLHHDMGLIGYLFLSLLSGVDLWLFPPTVFLARPHLWLQQIGRRGRVAAHGPNFGYQLCVDRLEKKHLEGLDLSGWEAAQTGAEMVRRETIEDFVAKFGANGFRPEAFRPSYGMAEATVCVSIDNAGRGLRTQPVPPAGEVSGSTSQGEVACVGAPADEVEVRIVSSDGDALPEGAVGEIQVRGSGLFLGYYRDPEATAEAMADGWLVTGDLGFLREGELYITGRIKDILILRGNNLMPHELEWLAEGVVGGGGALRCGAFSIEAGAQGEEAVLVVESGERDPAVLAELERRIRLEVAHHLGLQLADLVFVRRGVVPKTTSGKVQRRQLRELYLRGELRERLQSA